jgi:hypothetical protein
MNGSFGGVSAVTGIDPLLPIVCGKDPYNESKGFFDEIEAGKMYTGYDATEFPFFGQRILELHSFVEAQEPHNILDIWKFRWKKSFWWKFWVKSLNCFPEYSSYTESGSHMTEHPRRFQMFDWEADAAL